MKKEHMTYNTYNNNNNNNSYVIMKYRALRNVVKEQTTIRRQVNNKTKIVVKAIMIMFMVL